MLKLNTNLHSNTVNDTILKLCNIFCILQHHTLKFIQEIGWMSFRTPPPLSNSTWTLLGRALPWLYTMCVLCYANHQKSPNIWHYIQVYKYSTYMLLQHSETSAKKKIFIHAANAPLQDAYVDKSFMKTVSIFCCPKFCCPTFILKVLGYLLFGVLFV